MTTMESHHLDEVLADLVSHHVLAPDQARAVHDAMDADRPVSVIAPATVTPSPLRARLVEAAAYLGGVLVGASVLALVAQNWETMSATAHVTVLGGLGVTALAIGMVLALALAGGRAALLRDEHAPRRRVASVLLSLGAVLVAAAVGVQLEGVEAALFVASLVALSVLLVAQWLAPSVVSELVMFGSAAFAVGSGVGLLVPEQPLVSYDGDAFVMSPQPARLWDFAVPGAMAVLGVVWAAVVSRLLTVPMVATCVGLVVAFFASVSMAGSEESRTGGVLMLTALAAVSVAMFVTARTWPWLVAAVFAVTAIVFVLVAASGNPVAAFLVSGLVLLGGSGAVAWHSQRRRVHATS